MYPTIKGCPLSRYQQPGGHLTRTPVGRTGLVAQVV